MPKYGFIDPKDWVPGKVYGTRPDANCSKYLYIGGVFREKSEIKLADTGEILDDTSPWPYVFLKWKPVYDKYLRRSCGWNQILHDLMELTQEGPRRENWMYNLHCQDSKPEYATRFNREIKTLFDPTTVVPETITEGWIPCMLTPSRPHDIAYPAGYYVDDRNGTIPGFYRKSIILTPWTKKD